MRKEIYAMLCDRLSRLYELENGDYVFVESGGDIPSGASRLIRHIDLWNHNVEFIEQEEQWERPAVFVEFQPIAWTVIHPGVEYRAEPVVNLHVVTDWRGSTSVGSPFKEESLRVFDVLGIIHRVLAGVCGETFADFDLVGSRTNHTHEEIIENIESYQCVGIKSL